MRTLLFANNRLGLRVLEYLRERDELIGVVLHPLDRRRGLDVPDAGGGAVWTWPIDPEHVSETPACVLSVLFGFKLPSVWLEAATWRAINLHPGLLPWNRGADPNVWPLVDGSPAGTTLHVMDDEIDRGAIIAQRSVPALPSDTAATLYERLEHSSYDLFVESWPEIRTLDPQPQPQGGSSHSRADLSSLDVTREELAVIDKLRARTFPPFGCEVTRNGRRIQLQLTLQDLGPVDAEPDPAT